MLAPNTILQSRYRIVRKLGQGGMGAIYEAIDQRVSCVVALKETLVGSSATLREAFHREAALLANLRHSCLPKVSDYFSEGDGEFLVMEFIAGNDLLELLAQREGPLSQQQVILWAIELLKLLEYLHTHDPAILHRDIKPANLKVTKSGELFLLDFGLAKGSTGQMVTVETERSVPGYTPIYAPLEQILGHGTDQRSDLYAVGATLYHLLTGHAPVSAPARFSAIETDQPDPLKPADQVNVEIAPEVAVCIQTSMALSRRERTESARKMRVELERALKLIIDREIAEKVEQDLLSTMPERDPSKPMVLDENVQFTVYAPETIKPGKDYALLAFAHLTRPRDDAPPEEGDPIEEVRKQVERALGDQRNEYRDEKDSSSQPVPRGGELTFVPVVRGLTFNPSRRCFTWQKSVHREEFDVRASSDVDGQTLQGSMTVFLGSVVIADVGLKISVDSHAKQAKEKISLDQARSARRVKQVFASYSREDEPVVNELAQIAPLFGSRFLLDRTHLEPGEDRIEGVQRLIRDADVFQLFWSTNSMKSAEVAGEIRYAAGLGRPGFILPTHWEDPVPRNPAEGLPPPEIDRLQFYRIQPGAISQTLFGKTLETRLVILGPPGSEIYLDDERHGSIGGSGRVILNAISTGQHVLRVTHSGYRDDERVIEVRAGRGEQIFQAFASSPITEEAEPIGSWEVGQQITAPAPDVLNAPTGELAAPTQDRSPATTLGGPTGELSAPASPSPASFSTADDHVSLTCPSCGKIYYSLDLTFCLQCGSLLSRSEKVSSGPQASPLELPATASPKFQMPSAVKVERSMGSPVPKRRRGMLIPIFAGAAMVLFAIIVTPVWFVLNKGDSASQRPPLTTNTAANRDVTNTNTAANINTNTTANRNSNTTANFNGAVSPDLQFSSLDNARMRLIDFEGRVVLLTFWATWSEASRTEIPALNELHKKYESRGLSVIGLLKDDKVESVRELQRQIPQDYLIGFRALTIEEQLPAATLPTSYLIDRHGRVRKKMVGAQSLEALEDAIVPLIDER
jgi:serine/threonine protein kinase/thiol-disulfide isomerase/thioredoxin